MWLFTQQGFFSLTRSKDNPKKMQLRARSEEDLQNIQTLMGWKTRRHAIIETPAADYRYRIIMTPKDALAVTSALTTEIDYDNYKGRVEAIPSQRDKMPALHRVWGEMRTWGDDHRLQRNGQPEKPWEWEFEQNDDHHECTNCGVIITGCSEARAKEQGIDCDTCGETNYPKP